MTIFPGNVEICRVYYNRFSLSFLKYFSPYNTFSQIWKPYISSSSFITTFYYNGIKMVCLKFAYIVISNNNIIIITLYCGYFKWMYLCILIINEPSGFSQWLLVYPRPTKTCDYSKFMCTAASMLTVMFEYLSAMPWSHWSWTYIDYACILWNFCFLFSFGYNRLFTIEIFILYVRCDVLGECLRYLRWLDCRY